MTVTARARTRATQIAGHVDSAARDVYSLKGRARLVLVTCGGPFEPAAGRSIDDVVVTAVPVS